MDLLTGSFDGWSSGLLAKVVALTLFYSLLCYIPLRGGTAAYAWLNARRERKRRETAMRSIHVIR